MWLWFPFDENDAAGSAFRRNRWADGRVGDGEDYAVLAVSAYETDRTPVAIRAMEEAEKRGTDMAPLRALLVND